ncbi:hypothetical protein D9613_012640 [Agrocybe pediades]|uniref:Uncharacterized protein n=1 Tax=Agrocybe pediades TaxID=84607 RepID=A0A8H4VPE9_9AGAR|nr:hypothetical protein D9613_012640 [Agrocybe pediades]
MWPFVRERSAGEPGRLINGNFLDLGCITYSGTRRTVIGLAEWSSFLRWKEVLKLLSQDSILSLSDWGLSAAAVVDATLFRHLIFEALHAPRWTTWCDVLVGCFQGLALMSHAFPYSVTMQKAYISSDLNATLMYQFLFGIYTGFFPATIYIYNTRKGICMRSRDIIIIGSITALYTTTAVAVMLNWNLVDKVFCKNGGPTRVDIFIESLTADLPEGIIILNGILSYIGFFFADGLLVWRCYHACGRSIFKFFMPMALLTVETVLILTDIVYGCLARINPNFETDQATDIDNRLNTTTYIAVMATSLVATAVICLEIWQHTKHSSQTRKSYWTIISALIECSAMYTAAVFFQGALNFLSLNGSLAASFTVYLVDDYSSNTVQIISGVAPTLMVARLCMSSNQEDTEVSSVHLPSDLFYYVPHMTGTEAGDVDLEMQHNGDIAVGEEGIAETGVKARISADVNSTLLFQFLFGIYTGIFPTALYLYRRKENRTRFRDQVVIGSMSGLYFVTALYALVNWIYTDSLLCAEGGTRAEIFLENVTQALPKGVSLLADITEFAGFVLADGLLVWRCFNACRGSRPRSLLAVGLFIVETGLVVSGTIYQCLLDANPGFETNKRDRIFTRLIATMLVSVVATSLAATSMICWEQLETLHSTIRAAYANSSIWTDMPKEDVTRRRYETAFIAALAATNLRSYARDRWLRRNTRRVYFEVLLAERPADPNAEDAHVNASHHALRFIAINKYHRSELSARSVQGIEDELAARPGPEYIFGIMYRVIAHSMESFWTYRYVRMSDIFEGADRYFQLADGTHLVGIHNPLPPGNSDEEYEGFEDEGLEEVEE